MSHEKSSLTETACTFARGVVVELLAAGGPLCALNIPAGQWHTLRALESGTVILEMKDGAYETIAPEDVY